MRRSFIQPAGLFLMVVLVIPLVAARAQKRQPQWPNPAPLTPREKAIEVVRVINTAEYDYHTDHGRFGPWNEVYASGAVTNLEQNWPKTKDLSIASGSEVISPLSVDASHRRGWGRISLSLHEMQGHGCGLSVFSDQSGLIYQGTIIDSPQIVDDPR